MTKHFKKEIKKETDKWMEEIAIEVEVDVEDEIEDVEDEIEEVGYEFTRRITPYDLLLEWEDKDIQLEVEELDDENIESGINTASRFEANKFVENMVRIKQDIHSRMMMTDKMHDYLTAHRCFIDYLLWRGHIKKVKSFNPFTIEIRINRKEEFLALLKVLHQNCNTTYLKNPLYKEIRALRITHDHINSILVQAGIHIDRFIKTIRD